MPVKVDIAFRRKVRAIWLDHGLAMASQNIPWENAKPELAKEIAADNPGAETIRKVLEHVRRIWFMPSKTAPALHAAGLNLYREDNSPAARFILNWGMAIAAYPFVGAVAEALGRLIKLQKEAKRSDVQRRLREQFGDRDTINRLTRYNISSFLDWGALTESSDGGVYTATKQVRPTSPNQLAWLAEAVLISCWAQQMPVSQLCHHPMLFPIFVETVSPAILQCNPRLGVAPQGLNEDCVFLNTPNPRNSVPSDGREG